MKQAKKGEIESGIYPKGAFTLQDIYDSLKNHSEKDKIGSILSFSGIVRGTSKAGDPVIGMKIDAYDEMANNTIQEICKEIKQIPGIIDVKIIHFRGDFEISDDLLHVAVASSHRDEGFTALRDSVEGYKKKIEVWKKEVFKDGTSKWAHD